MSVCLVVVTLAKEIGNSNAHRGLANILPRLAHVDILLFATYVTAEAQVNVTTIILRSIDRL